MASTAARDIECRLVLLKGAATALRYYPAPHLRPTGDIDVLVPADRQPLLEARLRALGFQQRSNQPAAAFEGWHHSMPSYCSQRGTWIDVHTNVYPPQHSQAHDSLFSWQAITSQLSPVGKPINSPADLVYETMNLEMRVLEVDPIHRRIVLAVTNIPEEQPPRPETPPTIHTDDGEVPPIVPE